MAHPSPQSQVIHRTPRTTSKPVDKPVDPALALALTSGTMRDFRRAVFIVTGCGNE